MSTYRLEVLLHTTDDGGLVGSLTKPSLADIAALRRAGDPFEVEAEAAPEALEHLFREANIGSGTEWVRSYRDRDHARSLSVGDLVIVNAEIVCQCLSYGWGVLWDARSRVTDLLTNGARA